MIKGHATINATSDYVSHYAPVSSVPLGRTGLKASQAGFGGYRISSGVNQHEKALSAALRSGINLIDTGANYADGGSEMLVEYGQTLEHCIHPEFIEDQLTRSLTRLKLETLDGYLLHNPEY
jgi:aryl-alcohol dehydrogenase-like predicted oxidoreductase